MKHRTSLLVGTLALAGIAVVPVVTRAQTTGQLPPGHPPIGAGTPSGSNAQTGAATANPAPAANAGPVNPQTAPAVPGETPGTGNAPAMRRALPPGHPPIGPGEESPGPVVNPNAGEGDQGAADNETEQGSEAPANPGSGGGQGQLPPGHPPIPGSGSGTGGTGGTGGAGGMRQMPLPQSGSVEAMDLAPGTIDVRVVDPSGDLVAGASVRLGVMRDGEQQRAIEAVTGTNGVAVFSHLEGGTHVSYRASTEVEGANFSAEPFTLPANMGYHVQLVRFPVSHDPRAVLITEARFEVQFADDRLVVNEHISIVNFSNMAMGGQAPHPTAYVPTNGLRFEIPQGATAFREEPSMGDQHITETNGAAIMRGSIPPTGANGSVDLTFQYRVRYDGTVAPMDFSLPLPVLRAVIAAQAAPGMHLVAEGMDPAEERTFNGQHFLVVGRERASREDTGLDHLHVRLENIPSGAGPERTYAVIAASLLALGSVVFGFFSARERRLGPSVRRLDVLMRDRARLLAAAAEVAREHAAGDIGPETFNRRQRELGIALAGVLKEIADAKARGAGPKPASGKASSGSKKARAKGAKAP